jgi:peptidoglycan hydrolase-like protein with peptidoglycan-binding domain
MAEISVLERLIEDGAVARTLVKDSDASAEIKVLQEALYYLGFGKVLNWDRFGPDGDYGKGTTRAVKAFAKANGQTVDGTKVTAKLGRLIVQRFVFLDPMHHMQDAIKKPAILKDLRHKSPNAVAVRVLQMILNELGFGECMNWAKYGADGEYGKGTTKAVKAFADKHGLSSDGRAVTLEMAKLSLKGFMPFYGKDWYQESPKVVRKSLVITETNKSVTVSDGEATKKFGKHSRGLFTRGSHSIKAFVASSGADLKKLGMTASALNVMQSVSENEGNLDAINTWDNAFMTFGCFQWTVGTGSAQGELPALFKKIKDADPAVFQDLYGQHGIDLWSKTGAVRGHLTLHGQIVNDPVEKTQFRAPEWCFRFWKAGQHPLVQMISIQHAFSRLDWFYRSPKAQVHGHDIADIVTSEYGVALILDNHVNRPAYVHKVLARAMTQTGLEGTNPRKWKTAEEQRLIKKYLVLRITHGSSPMTDAAHRGKRTKAYVTKGIISDARGSFKLS